eukprot:SM000071S21087  [mRNA]  locus=s71:299484:300774:+ [translate_table: standard]
MTTLAPPLPWPSLRGAGRGGAGAAVARDFAAPCIVAPGPSDVLTRLLNVGRWCVGPRLFLQFKTLTPLGDRVLVKIQTKEEKSQGGILLPTAAQTKPQGGEVVAVGDGRTLGDKKVAIDIQTGSKIVYSKYAGTEVEFDGAEHLLLKEDDVIGLLSSDDIEDLKPLNDRVLIKVAEAESKTAGGVLLTDSAKEKPVVGTVVATGPGPLGEDGSRKPLDITEGNTVLYSKYAGSDFKSKDGTQFVVLRGSDVMAILS